jgi:hypothetical protein
VRSDNFLAMEVIKTIEFTSALLPIMTFRLHLQQVNNLADSIKDSADSIKDSTADLIKDSTAEASADSEVANSSDNFNCFFL